MSEEFITVTCVNCNRQAQVQGDIATSYYNEMALIEVGMVLFEGDIICVDDVGCTTTLRDLLEEKLPNVLRDKIKAAKILIVQMQTTITDLEQRVLALENP